MSVPQQKNEASIFFSPNSKSHGTDRDGLSVLTLQDKCEAKPVFMPRDFYTQTQGSSYISEHCVKKLSDILHLSVWFTCERTLPPVDTIG